MKQAKQELIREWHRDHYNVRLYDTFRNDSYNKWVIAWRFSDTQANVVFTSENGCELHTHTDPYYSPEAVYELLSFIALQPGDTDDEYFDNYTPEQLTWAESNRCEELSYIVFTHDEKQ